MFCFHFLLGKVLSDYLNTFILGSIKGYKSCPLYNVYRSQKKRITSTGKTTNTFKPFKIWYQWTLPQHQEKNTFTALVKYGKYCNFSMWKFCKFNWRWHICNVMNSLEAICYAILRNFAKLINSQINHLTNISENETLTNKTQFTEYCCCYITYND